MKKLNRKFFILFSVMFLFALGFVSAKAQMPNPTQAQTDEARRANICTDPWVSIALQAYRTGAMPQGKGGEGECNPKNYNGGNWNSFNDLFNAVVKYQNGLRSNGVRWEAFKDKKSGDILLAFLEANGAASDGRVISHNGSTLKTHLSEVIIGMMVAAGAGNMVAAGAGNAVPTGGGNFLGKVNTLIGTDGASMVAAGAGNAKVLEKLKAAGAVAEFYTSPPEITTNPPYAQLSGSRKYRKIGSVYYIWR